MLAGFRDSDTTGCCRGTPVLAAWRKAVKTAKWDGAEVIRVLAKDNPKKAGSKSAARFALYRTGMTVEQARKAGVQKGDIVWDALAGDVSISAPTAKAKPKANGKAAQAQQPEALQSA